MNGSDRCAHEPFGVSETNSTLSMATVFKSIAQLDTAHGGGSLASPRAQSQTNGLGETRKTYDEKVFLDPSSWWLSCGTDRELCRADGR